MRLSYDYRNSRTQRFKPTQWKASDSRKADTELARMYGTEARSILVSNGLDLDGLLKFFLKMEKVILSMTKLCTNRRRVYFNPLILSDLRVDALWYPLCLFLPVVLVNVLQWHKLVCWWLRSKIDVEAAILRAPSLFETNLANLITSYHAVSYHGLRQPSANRYISLSILIEASPYCSDSWADVRTGYLAVVLVAGQSIMNPATAWNPEHLWRYHSIYHRD